MTIKQVDVSCETFKCDRFGLALVFDMFEKFTYAYDNKCLMQVKVLFTNHYHNVCMTKIVSFDIRGSWLDNMYTTLILEYECWMQTQTNEVQTF